jgi:hypothetical protein
MTARQWPYARAEAATRTVQTVSAIKTAAPPGFTSPPRPRCPAYSAPQRYQGPGGPSATTPPPECQSPTGREDPMQN